MALKGKGKPRLGEAKAVGATEAALRKRAVHWLARREHSRFELMGKLEHLGATPEQIAALLEELSAKGLQSDARFAEALVASRVRRGQGPLRIRRELAESGIEGALIESVLRQSETDWCALAGDVYRRKYGSAAISGWAERARRARFLSYRGFDAEVIRTVLSSRLGVAEES